MNRLSTYTLILWTLFCFGYAHAELKDEIPKRPSPPKFVNDFTSTLSSGDKTSLERKLEAYFDSTSTQVVVVIIPSLNDNDVKEYAYTIGDEWGVGQKGKDNGVVILIAIGDRKMAIQTGRGAEGGLTDIESKMIIDEVMKPQFKSGNFYGGINGAIDGIIIALKGEFKSDGEGKSARKSSWLTYVIILGVIALIYFFSRRSGGGGYTTYSSGGGFWGGGGSWGGGGGSSGGGGGGWDFGGGSFGGGGASGDW